MKIVSKQREGHKDSTVLVEFTDEDLRGLNLVLHRSDGYQKTSTDAEVLKMFRDLIDQHTKAARVVLDNSPIHRVIVDALERLKKYGEASQEVVLAGMPCETRGER